MATRGELVEMAAWMKRRVAAPVGGEWVNERGCGGVGVAAAAWDVVAVLVVVVVVVEMEEEEEGKAEFSVACWFFMTLQEAEERPREVIDGELRDGEAGTVTVEQGMAIVLNGGARSGLGKL